MPPCRRPHFTWRRSAAVRIPMRPCWRASSASAPEPHTARRDWEERVGVDWEERVDFERLRTERLARIKRLLKDSELGALLCFDLNNGIQLLGRAFLRRDDLAGFERAMGR